MASMDIFNSDAFHTVSLTTALEKIPYKPQFLNELNIFEPVPTNTRSIAIEKRDGFMQLIPTSQIGSAPTQLQDDKRDIRNYSTKRWAKAFTLYAEQLSGIRQFGTETELMQVQAEAARRLSRLKDDFDLTAEFARLGALQGKWLDSDGSVLIDWFAEWGISPNTPVAFAFSDDTINVNDLCKKVARGMARAAKGGFTTSTTVHALVGDAFFDALVKHPSVDLTYKNWLAAEGLRATQASVFDAFYFGGIYFHNYRGTDDKSTVAVADNAAVFFPVGVRDLFQVAYGPAEFDPWINTFGQEQYALTIPDRDRNAWTKFEIYSYPLYICTRPEVLYTGTAS
ncbi:major capsid protein [Rhizobium sp. SG741]|uniref:major capsid protein n=1 Tax=Rhizobium sp. SG741 TaxID=2587114 RepID=UPI00144650C0|nr:major capsid protein [Rhizobium sp. SG741]NKJ03130.1 hypothetical protein [Rhizobium sp. SG741]